MNRTIPRIVVTGAGGQVGWELLRSLSVLGEVIPLSHRQADLARPESLPTLIDELMPDVIVNAAAYTAVDKAEEEEVLATRINGEAVGVLAQAARRHNALFVHYSTDYVFDGTKGEPYTEQDTPNPLNAYGRSKLAGDRAIEAVGGDYLILRTTWVYAARGKNFVKTVLRLAAEREELRIVADQHGAPTWARNIADATAGVVHCAGRERDEGRFSSGLFHLTGAGATTWQGFASAIVEGARARMAAGSIKTVRVSPIATEDYPLPARRPKNSRLAPGRLRQRFGVVMPEWERSLDLCMDELAGQAR